MNRARNIRAFMRLYAVTDRAWCGEKSLCDMVDEALQGGVSLVQLREKNLSDDDFLNEALEVQKLCKKYGVPLIINDNVEIAKKIKADGVHIGQSDMGIEEARRVLGKDYIIGVSAHNREEALLAERNGADYLGLGAVFRTNTKTDVDVMSARVLKEITNAVHIPTCAIGGINKNNIIELRGSGIDGVAVVSAIFASENIILSTKELLKCVNEIL